MKKILFLLVVLCSLTLVSGCISETPKLPAKETAAPAAKVKADLFRNTEALAQFQKDVKEKFGPDLKYFAVLLAERCMSVKTRSLFRQ